MGHRAVRTPEPLDRLRKGPVARQQLRSRRIHPADGVGEDQRADPSPTFGNPTDTRYIHEVVPFHERHVVSSTAARACSRHAAVEEVGSETSMRGHPGKARGGVVDEMARVWPGAWCAAASPAVSGDPAQSASRLVLVLPSR